MLFATIQLHGRVAFGPVVDSEMLDVSDVFHDQCEALDLANGGRLALALDAAQRLPLRDATFLPPVPNPRRILCIGVNYATHRAESDRATDSPYPTVFVRFPSSIVGHEQPIIRPRVSDRFDWEGELAVVIGLSLIHI